MGITTDQVYIQLLECKFRPRYWGLNVDKFKGMQVLAEKCPRSGQVKATGVRQGGREGIAWTGKHEARSHGRVTSAARVDESWK